MVRRIKVIKFIIVLFIVRVFSQMMHNVPRLCEVAAFLIVYCKDIKISIRHISVLEKLNQPLRETAVVCRFYSPISSVFIFLRISSFSFAVLPLILNLSMYFNLYSLSLKLSYSFISFSKPSFEYEYKILVL